MRNFRSAILVALFAVVVPMACDSAGPPGGGGGGRAPGSGGSGLGGATGTGGGQGGTGGGAPGSGGSQSGNGGGGDATGGKAGNGAGAVGGAGTGGRSSSGGHNDTGGAAAGGRGGTGGTGVGGGRGGADAPPVRCSYGGMTYPVGASFPATDGCNTCTCGANGSVGCTKIGCVDGGPDTTCAFDMPFKFWDDGGLRAYTDLSQVPLPHTHTVGRDHHGNAPPVTCSREIPCTSATEADVAKIKEALGHADVAAALAMTTKPFYGTDTRPADGTVFIFERGDKRGFSLGSGTAVPAGLRALQTLLHDLQTQTVASAACANLR